MVVKRKASKFEYLFLELFRSIVLNLCQQIRNQHKIRRFWNPNWFFSFFYHINTIFAIFETWDKTLNISRCLCLEELGKQSKFVLSGLQLKLANIYVGVKGTHEIDFKNVDENRQTLSLMGPRLLFEFFGGSSDF